MTENTKTIGIIAGLAFIVIAGLVFFTGNGNNTETALDNLSGEEAMAAEDNKNLTGIGGPDDSATSEQFEVTNDSFGDKG